MLDSVNILDTLSPTDFECLARRFLWRWGFYNVERIGGTGDRGRDLLAQSIERPLPGRQIVRQWLIQCKRWRRPPSKKRLHDGFAAAVQHHPDYYLLLGTFTITSALFDWLESIRSDYPFDILVIGRDEIKLWLECSSDIAYDLYAGIGRPAPYTSLMTTLISDLGPEITAGPQLLVTLSLAMTLCCSQGDGMLTSLHLLIALNLQSESTASAVLESCGLPVRRLQRILGGSNLSGGQEACPSVSKNTRAAMRAAAAIAVSSRKSSRVDEIDLLAGLLEQRRSSAVAVLKTLSVDLDRLAETIVSIQNSSASTYTPLEYLHAALTRSEDLNSSLKKG